MWWTSAHKSIVDRLTPEQLRDVKNDDSIHCATRRLQKLLHIKDMRLALHLVRGVQSDTVVSRFQQRFEAETAVQDRDAYHIVSL